MRNDIKAVLFDLDGTLLPMDTSKFMKEYFILLSKKLSDFGVTPERFLGATVKSLHVMAENLTDRMNSDIFWEFFKAEFGVDESAFPERTSDFYRNEYLSLKSICGFDPDAGPTVKALKDMGYRLVLATNPLFPRVAITERLKWTGVDIGDFEFITTYESYHSCKPSPLYYKEIAKNLGLSPSEIMMVGNDTNDDMSAEKIGMKVFLLTKCLINRKGLDISAFPNGEIKDLIEVLS